MKTVLVIGSPGFSAKYKVGLHLHSKNSAALFLRT